MRIIESNRELTPMELYNLTSNPETAKMRTFIGSELEIDAWAIYEDVDKKTGELHNILAILTKDGEVVGTNSDTFMEELKRGEDLFGQFNQHVTAIEVITGTSKAGREFVSCKITRAE